MIEIDRPPFYEFGPFRLAPSEHTLWRDGQPVPLRPKVFDILLVLVERHGHLVEKEALMRAVWPEQFVEEGNLNKNISMLRISLGESPAAPAYIETVPKRGYRFVAEVRSVNGNADAELVFETRTRTSLIVEEETDDETRMADGGALVADAVVLKPVTAQPAGKFKRLLNSRVALAAAATVIMLAAAGYLFYPARGGEALDSVAVLPFVNESGNPDAEYLSDGISESLINSLSRLPGVKVIARSSSFQYKGKEIDVQEAARALGVEAVLTGRIAQRGEKLFISVELVDARDRTQVWGERYNREARDLLAVESDISREIAETLRLRLTAGEQQRLARRETVSPQAYELLLKGRFYRNKGATEDFKKAIDFFQQAIAVDANYALAHAELFRTFNNLVNANVLDPKEFTPKAEAAAHKALELDESLAEAHLAVAKVKLNGWDWASAEREIKRAIELNPSLAWAHVDYTFYLIIRGRYGQVLDEAKRARELDPLSLGANKVVIYGLLLSRQYDQALEAAKKLLELDESNPDLHALLGQIHTRRGEHREAVAAWHESIRLGDTSPDAQIFLGASYARAGEREKARAILKLLENGKGYVSPVGLAMLHATLGEREQALALLERAYGAHDQQLIWLGVEPGFDSLRTDPRFQDLMRRLGLAQ